jgi:hypothetical protein
MTERELPTTIPPQHKNEGKYIYPKYNYPKQQYIKRMVPLPMLAHRDDRLR